MVRIKMKNHYLKKLMVVVSLLVAAAPSLAAVEYWLLDSNDNVMSKWQTWSQCENSRKTNTHSETYRCVERQK